MTTHHSRWQLTEHPQTLQALLESHTDAYVRRQIANSARVSVNALVILAGDSDAGIRRCVSDNPRTPPTVLTALATDTDVLVRKNVARHPNTAPDTLTRLAADTDRSVRWRVAEHPNTPTHTIRALATDTSHYVAHAASTCGRANCLTRYANTLPEPDRSHALLLVEAGFPGWPDQLATVLTSQRHISTPTMAGRTARPDASTQPTSSGYSH